MVERLRITATAIERYRELVLHGTGRIDRSVAAEIEAELLCLLSRCFVPHTPRYAIIVGQARFIVVDGAVVTTLHRNDHCWTGIHRPGRKLELDHAE
ncbi:hypothetical protein [Mangrovibrevibacter kandeliae]|uniref:hypothetical protein n=1 Tax=Mangrovibrevibacter kandeliae TaxID=2968473 RepID=UPI002117B548|nr:hypothetical protein [Aurantimonas sp. CSK15Z-1]MCQ8781684.1 hypothetical protein [Aurantimonas sp. CSK15Z-1]